MYSGKPYISRDGTAMEGRKMRPNCAPYCRSDCSQLINDEQRQKLFDHYYSLGDLHRQWTFLSSLIDRTKPKLRSAFDPPVYNKRNAAPKIRQRVRSANKTYHLEAGDGNRIRVCQNMFLATFDIYIGVVTSVLNKTNVAGELIDYDRRGYKTGRNLKKKK